MTRPGSGTTSKSAPCTGSPGGRTDTTSTQDRETAFTIIGVEPALQWNFSQKLAGRRRLSVYRCRPECRQFHLSESCPSFGCGTRAGRLPCDIQTDRAREQSRTVIMGSTEPSDRQDLHKQSQSRRLDSHLEASALDRLKSSFTIPRSCRLSARRRYAFNGEGSTPTR